MKRLIYILPLVVFAIACNNRTAEEKLVAIDSLVVQELYDSAYTVLTGIDTTLLNDMETRAHYYLARKQVGYLTSHRDSSNVLDSIVIPYYTSTDNKEKLADAYYYKAYGEIKQKHISLAVVFYKYAEKLASETNNIKLQYKIAESLAYTNFVSGNYILQTDYLRKAIAFAQTIDNKDLQAHSLLNMAYAQSCIGCKDSIVYYSQKASNFSNFIDIKDKQAFLSNLAYINKYNQPEIAKGYYQEALQLGESSIILENMADIYYNEGQQEEAYHLLKRALAINDNNPKDNILHNLLEYDLEHGKTDEVFKRVNEIIAIKDSIIDNLKNDTIRNLQLNFDHEVEMNAAHERLIRWQRALGIIAFLALCLIGYILWRKHKVRLQRLENELLTKDYIRKMLDLELRATKTETQLAALQSENDENRQEIQRLETEKAEVEEEAKRLLGKETQIIRRGMLLYDQLLKSERVQTWTNSDYEAIAGFFEASHPDAMKEILKKYGRPTTRSMLYLILVDMGKSNDEICRIMSLNGSSLRSLKHRLRKNMEDSQ